MPLLQLLLLTIMELRLPLSLRDADAGLGPQLDLFRNHGQAGTDGDLIGQISFFGLNDEIEHNTLFIRLMQR